MAYPHLEKALDQKKRLAKEGAAKESKIRLANENLDIARNRVGAPGSPKREEILLDINARKAAIASTKVEIIAKEKELKVAEKEVKEIVKVRNA